MYTPGDFNLFRALINSAIHGRASPWVEELPVSELK